jgi:GMP synthase-like glutamine amidotransferase
MSGTGLSSLGSSPCANSLGGQHWWAGNHPHLSYYATYWMLVSTVHAFNKHLSVVMSCSTARSPRLSQKRSIFNSSSSFSFTPFHSACIHLTLFLLFICISCHSHLFFHWPFPIPFLYSTQSSLSYLLITPPNPIPTPTPTPTPTHSPRIYAGCFGCQIVAHALKGSVDLNPTKRFVLKAETIEVVHDFEEHLLFDCCSFSCCPTVPIVPTANAVLTAQQDELKEGLLVSEERSSLLQYVTQGCCQTTSCCAEAPSSTTAPSSSTTTGSSSSSSPSSSSSTENKYSSQPSQSTLGSVCDVSNLGSEILRLSQEQKPDKKSTSQIITLTGSESSEFCDENDGNTIVNSDSTLCHTVQHTVTCDDENESDTVEDTADKSGKVGSYKLIVSHGDCVCVLPPESVLLGSSQTCANEMYLTGKYRNIFACQSHPEFEYEYCIKERIWPAVTETRKRLNDEEIKAAAESFENFNREDSKCLLSMIKSFLQLPCTFCTSCH